MSLLPPNPVLTWWGFRTRPGQPPLDSVEVELFRQDMEECRRFLIWAPWVVVGSVAVGVILAVVIIALGVINRGGR